MERTRKIWLAKGAVILSVIPVLLYAYEYGPDAGVAGVPGEGGTCSQVGCHIGTAVNSTGGNVTVVFPNGTTYAPGVTQHLVVKITDAAARRWGFELTARTSDPKTMAGTFSPTDKRTQLMCASADLVRQINDPAACPSNMPLHYIQHTLDGYRVSQPNPGTFEFDWRPPATDAGPVTIYVAANAANGDLTEKGDHIYTATFTLTATAAPPPPQPTVSAVINPASELSQGLPNSGLAQGSVILINGTNLGPDPASQSGYPLSATLAGTSVQVTVNGTNVAALLSLVSATQVRAVLPSSAPTGAGTLTVTANGQTSAPVPVQVASSGFGIYTQNGSGTGPAAATGADGSTLSFSSPGRAGQTVTITGTGLGPIGSGDDSPPPATDLGAAVSAVYVGGQQAGVQFAGRLQSGGPGQDQITFVIPDGVTGCYVPVVVMTGNVPSNSATLPIAAGDDPVCSDANGFSSAQVQQVTSGQQRVGRISVTRSADSATTDSAAASFLQYMPDQLSGSLGLFTGASLGGCLVFPYTGDPVVSDGISAQGLDAGGALTLSGPNGDKKVGADVKKTGQYAALLGSSKDGGTLYLDPGSYTVSAPGGSNVGDFNTSVQAPQPVTLTSAPASVDRTQGLTVTWTGGDPAGFVIVSGASALSSGPGAMFTCAAPAASGTLTVPAAATLALPASATATLTVTSVAQPAPFTASGIDAGMAVASSAVSQPVAIQ